MIEQLANSRILILGARGMLGTDLASEFSGTAELFLLDKEELDITNEVALKTQITALRPGLIINATGYTDVAGAERNRELAFNLNCEAVKHLVAAASEVEAAVIHFSTEYVFNGQAEDGYDEAAAVSPLNVYGESKAAGESFIKSYQRGYLIRSSWLYGQAPQRGKPRGLNFVDTIIKLASEQSLVKVVNDEWGKLTYTRDLAKAVKQLISGGYAPGIYHLVNETEATWYEIAQAVYRLKNITTPLAPISSAEYAGEVKRPARAVLINTKFPRLRPWPRALTDYLNIFTL
ncbi:MAG: dTDP-4-dehydrorhamnose reductase [Candidatus Kerfeldbacteria bacterium]|nr:dTDP-4-dehydrorhamnose reductase [Candidatus Kerfeldbacteria bacterium]